MRCEKCGGKMVKVYRFEPNKAFEFNRCQCCWFETRHVKANFDNLQLMQENSKTKIPRIKHKYKKGRSG